ncbi:DNA internalization-related competence protein ComEC/Rec2 [Levilactobacillus tangyuanensis]|uniref:DNA internalization-related competence protein ComEC/Rec2 n=1 Tax=Levilactobacillus tangyuanensis TaxID=2486021 RepID=A0ABW1TLQ8_9LACO|nr:DNA internalization-related competence protein ComEC/Rec2 [Levilactobacillus tangyuanensis]
MTLACFFLSLTLAAISVLAGGHLWGGLVLLLVVLFRVLTLKSRLVLIVTVIGGGLFGGWLWVHQERLSHRQLALGVKQVQSMKIRVQPDAIVLRGTGYYFVGQDMTSHDWVTVHGQLRSASEQMSLQAVDRPQTWQVTGEVTGLLPATNFNQFDAARYWFHRGIVRSVKLTAIDRRQASVQTIWQRWPDTWHHWRARLIHYCERLPSALSVYALGLFPGSKSSAFVEEMQGMKSLGLLHLFAISGLHVALFLGALEWLAVHGRLPREWWEWGLVASLPGYLILAGSGSGVLRACLMHGSRLMGKRLGFRLDRLTSWSLALVIGLVVNPGLLFELGGQLSYGLSLGLILWEHESLFWRQLGLTLLSLPGILTAFFQWHLLTVVANWLVVPLFPTVILPLTVVGTVSFPWFPRVSWACSRLLGGFDSLLRLVGQLPGNLLVGKPIWWVAWLWVVLTWHLFSRPVKARKMWVGILIVTYAGMFGWNHWPLTGEVAYFDVGQGDSILLREPFNRRVSLIDTGGRLAFPQPSWAKRVPKRYGAETTSINYLHSRGIHRIDDLYLTHHDTDHIGDLPAFLNQMQVTRILVPAGMEREPSWQRGLNLQGVQLLPIKVGMPLPVLVRHPYESAPAENGNSLALQTQAGGLNFLFMGDLDRPGEQKMMTADSQLQTDVLKLGHHGSKTASAPAFIQQLQPRLAIISAGRDNRYGHPNPETLTTLAQAHLPALSTQTSGMIRYVYRGERGQWQTKLGGRP